MWEVGLGGGGRRRREEEEEADGGRGVGRDKGDKGGEFEPFILDPMAQKFLCWVASNTLVPNRQTLFL